jgi:hypothetical protein
VVLPKSLAWWNSVLVLAARGRDFVAFLLVAALLAAVGMTGCSGRALPRGMIGRVGRYDYSPSVIQSGNVRQFWWCGLAKNPVKHSQETDAILYESVNLLTNETAGPVTVLAETPGGWDAEFTCNPKVIGGTFNNPLGDSQTYQYAMYYVGIQDGSNNNIGVAFSHDGITWKKFPNPVIRADSPTGYGVGQPAVYNRDHRAGITVFYESDFPTVHHVKATSADGVHFTVQGTITTNGLDSGCPGTWGDMAYDAKTNYWYAVFDRTLRDPKTTGGIVERGQFGVELLRIKDSAVLNGSAEWEPLTIIDTNVTGFESNFIAGLVRDPYGNLNVGEYPNIQLYVSVSDPQPAWNASPRQAGKSADPSSWDIAPIEWVPNQPLKSLGRYVNNETSVVTTGWVSGHFTPHSVLGHVYENPRHGAPRQLYSCRSGATDYFVSPDPACEGERILGSNGFVYSEPGVEFQTIPLYRCAKHHMHFVSQDAGCEGATNEGLLGYALP